MSFKYEKVADNILKYTTKSGMVKYRVVITINNVPIDKSGLKNITAARNFIKAKTAEILSGEYEKGKSKEYTFQEYWEYYHKQKTTPKGVSGKPKWNKTSDISISNNFQNHILPYFKDKKLSDVSRMGFEDFAYHLIEEKGLRTVSAEHIIGLVSTMLKDAVLNEAVDMNRTMGVTVPTSPKKPYDKEITKEQYQQLVEHFNWRHIADQARFYLLSLGLRRSEAVGLTVGSIEFVDEYAKILVDKSRPPAYPEGKSTKTNEPRVVYAPPKIANVLKEYLKWMKKRYKLNDKTLHKNDWLLISINKLTPISPVTISSTIKRSGEELGFDVTSHKLRHYFATQAKLDGVDIRLIADTLGHKSLSTTDGYSHGKSESARKIVDMVSFL